MRVNQILVGWKHQGLLSVDGRQGVTLRNRGALAALVPGLRTEPPWREL